MNIFYDVKICSESIREITNQVRSWFNENGLQLNPDKSEAILLGTPQRLKTIDLPSVTVAGSSINTVDKLKSLGVTIDSALTFDQQVKNISRSSYSNIRALRQIRTALTRDTAKAVAAAIVSTRLDYCNSLLYGTTDTNITKLQRIQNSLAGVVTGTRKYEHITPVLRDLHWLRIEERIIYKLDCLTFKAKLVKEPLYLSELLRPHRFARPLRSTHRDMDNLDGPLVLKLKWPRELSRSLEQSAWIETIGYRHAIQKTIENIPVRVVRD